MTKISEAGREILKKWQDMGVKFEQVAMPINTYLDFKRDAENYSIPEQPMPESWTSANFNDANYYGLKFNTRGDWPLKARIIAQPIPKELLEMEEPKKEILIHHIPERKLWLAQREAGTNEQWQEILDSIGAGWVDIPVEVDPKWNCNCKYRPKPKTVKYYFCAIRHKNGSISTHGQYGSKEELTSCLALRNITILGNIEERDVVV